MSCSIECNFAFNLFQNIVIVTSVHLFTEAQPHTFLAKKKYFEFLKAALRLVEIIQQALSTLSRTSSEIPEGRNTHFVCYDILWLLREWKNPLYQPLISRGYYLIDFESTRFGTTQRVEIRLSAKKEQDFKTSRHLQRSLHEQRNSRAELCIKAWSYKWAINRNSTEKVRILNLKRKKSFKWCSREVSIDPK